MSQQHGEVLTAATNEAVKKESGYFEAILTSLTERLMLDDNWYPTWQDSIDDLKSLWKNHSYRKIAVNLATALASEQAQRAKDAEKHKEIIAQISNRLTAIRSECNDLLSNDLRRAKRLETGLAEVEAITKGTA